MVNISLLPLYIFANIILILICIFSDSVYIKEVGFEIILISTILSLIYAYKGSSDKNLFSPFNFSLIFIVLSMMLGSFAFDSGLVLNSRNLIDFQKLKYVHLSIATYIMTICSITIMLKNYNLPEINFQNVKFPMFNVLIVSLTVLPLVILDYFVFEGKTFTPYCISTIAASLFIYFWQQKSEYRAVFYILVFLALVYLNPHDKRIAIFSVFPLIYLETKLHKYQINIRFLLTSFFLSALGFFAIVAMSITRGYGGFDAPDVIRAVPYMLEYLNSDIFIAAFLQNIEVAYVFFHYLNAMEYLFSNSFELLLGTSLIKPFFLFVPESAFGYKPDSMIHTYTTLRDPEFRAIGGSWPVIFFAEFFYNFHLFGIFPIMLVIYFFARHARKILNTNKFSRGFAVLYFFLFYQFFLMFIRGSGLDLYMFAILITVFVTFSSYLVHRGLRTGAKN